MTSEPQKIVISLRRASQIWQDIRRIRIGWPWNEEVQAGLPRTLLG
jgi:hypothetical protein